MAQNFLIPSRHGTIFYYRRRVPNDLRPIIGRSYLTKSLDTSNHANAVVLARKLATRTDDLYEQLRTMKKKTESGSQFDYKYEVELDESGAVKGVRVDATSDETDAVNKLLATTLQNLPTKSVFLAQAIPVTPGISSTDLLDAFFVEGTGANRWKSPATTRTHDYAPIWKKFEPFVEKHGLTLKAAKAYRDSVLASEFSQETKHRNLYRIHAVVSFGVAHHDLDSRMLDQLKMPKVKGRGKNSRAISYLPFTQEELFRLFHSPAYQQNTFKKPSHYWLPLLGLYTGARLDELAGLHLSVFQLIDGFEAVVLSDDETTDGGKNEYALRQVPLHPELVKAGLLDYVQLVKSEGHIRLFPDIGEAARDGFGKRATDDFIKYRRSVGVGKGAGERSRKVFHSFRSTLAGKFYHHGIDGDLSRRLTGHAALDVHQGTYLAAAAIPMERASEAMGRISFNLVHPKFTDTATFKKSRNRKRGARSK